jgi:hypothetical protein
MDARRRAMSGVPSEFVLAVAEHEDLSVSVEESGEAHVTKATPDDDSSIGFDAICSLVHKHSLAVVGGVAFYDGDGHGGRVLVKVAPEGWQSGNEGGEE